jgi:hypothetical protein
MDTETVTISSGRGRWKSTRKGNSLVAYSTARPVLRGGGGSDTISLPNQVGVTTDPTFGPLLVCGLGGTLDVHFVSPVPVYCLCPARATGRSPLL